jgi:GntR family transcriptional regulator
VITIDSRSPVPIFEQIKSGLRGLVARGLLKPGDQVPAIRNLAETILVNPNTIARAYRELTLEGFLEPRRGEGNFIASGAEDCSSNGLSRAKEQLRAAIRISRRAGLSWREIQSTVQQAKGEEEK